MIRKIVTGKSRERKEKGCYVIEYEKEFLLSMFLHMLQNLNNFTHSVLNSLFFQQFCIHSKVAIGKRKQTFLTTFIPICVWFALLPIFSSEWCVLPLVILQPHIIIIHNLHQGSLLMLCVLEQFYNALFPVCIVHIGFMLLNFFYGVSIHLSPL